MVGLVGKTPTELNLKDCIKIYIKHNIECIKREAAFDRDKALARLEIVDGLLIALADIDNIIAIIKKSESSAAAKEALIKKYEFTDNQVTAILNMKLSSLAKLEGVKLENEKEDLKKTIKYLENLIIDELTQIKELTSRLDEIVRKYGDERKTELAQIEVPKEEKEVALVEPEDVVVICTQSGDIKRVPKTSFKIQKRNGKGVKTQDDAILSSISTNTIDTLLIFTSEGRMFRMLVDNVPAGTNTTRGTNLATLLKFNPNEKVMYVTSQFRETNAKYVVFFTKNGLIKKTKLEEFKNTKKTTGIQAIKFKDGDSLANVTLLNDEDVIVITKNGMGIKFITKDIAPIGRVAAGVKAIKLREGDEVLVGLPMSKNNDVSIFTVSGYGKRVKATDFPVQNRGGVGVMVAESSKVAGVALVDNTDNILIIGRPNSICIDTKGIPVLGRTAAGVQIVNGSKIERVIKL
jgi:DNA gyrase subunit A